MHHVLKLAGAALPLIFTVFAWNASGESCLAQQQVINGAKIQSAGCAISSVSAVAPHRKMKSIPATVEVYQYDNSPLGHRQPLLLIHGLVGEFHPLFRWKELADYLSQNQSFQDRYKIYLVRYNTRSSLKDITGDFNRTLRDLAPTGGLTIVAISLAGTIVRDAMRDPAVDQSVSRVITLGTFFRGSPLFCTDWMKQTIRERHLSPLYRIDHSLLYKLYFSRHKNLLRDYQWDNADGQMPAVRSSNARTDVESTSNSAAPTQLVAGRQPSDSKFVVYAGYLHNQYFPHPHGAVHAFLASPFTFLWTTLPAHCGREHAALRYIDELIAGTVPKRDSSSIIYPLNDGISPISSSLLLSNEFVAQSPLRDEEGINNVRTNSNAKKARLFDNVDHLTYIERHRPLGSSEDVVDVLSRSEKPRSMFAWILKDLLE